MNVKPPQNKASRPVKEWSPLELAEMKTGKYLGQIHRPKGFASRRRIKPEKGAACFHVMSRTVNGEFLFGPTEKEGFRRMMWRMAQFSGVEIFTYVVMDNHFHILLKVPDREKWLRKFEDKVGKEPGAGEERLLAHLSTVYSKAFLKQVRNELKSLRERGMEAEALTVLQRFKDRFCDVSLFTKELKERFSRWFNKQNGRRGTLWMDRFKSVLVEGEAALATMAAYIDLNPVRAGIMDDPMLYEYSGYGDATNGSKRARRGLCKALNLPQDSWETRGLARYRLFLFDEGLPVEPKSTSLGKGKRKRRGIKMGARTEVIANGGEISPAQALRKRVASFSNGVAVGSERFVRRVASRYRKEMGRKKERHPRAISEGGGFFVMRGENLE
jgi:REP element-mobilizing transposase RayT